MKATRYIRAFFRALTLTLRGQKPPTLEAEERFAGLLQWSREALTSVDAVHAAIHRQGVDARAVIQHIEGRDVSLEHALSVVRYHLTREYPHLIRSGTTHTKTAIHALNFNDQFLIHRMSEHEGLPAPVREALKALYEQLSEKVKE